MNYALGAIVVAGALAVTLAHSRLVAAPALHQ